MRIGLQVALADQNVLAIPARAGFQVEFREALGRHESLVFSLAYHFLGDRSLAEEVAQDVFVGLHRALKSNPNTFASAEHVEHWLRRLTMQRSIDASRRRGRRAALALEQIPEPAAKPSGNDPLLEARLRKLVATLPETARAVVVLRFEEDLSPAEIAETLELPVATVKSHLQRSLLLLREKLKRSGTHGPV